jgi:DNA-directed RNA polymerase subunit RPC12/RpoP
MNSQDKEKMIKESKWEECDNCGKEYFNTEQETKEGFETWCKNCRNKLIEKTAQEKDKEIKKLYIDQQTLLNDGMKQGRTEILSEIFNKIKAVMLEDYYGSWLEKIEQDLHRKYGVMDILSKRTPKILDTEL